ncbi:Mu transposase C-terminal domain-containing protein [Undibacterium sp.]|uniref:Mu transposase C-terminal domain-containing protein n=1 Tax=Undibacterium sp. TaxID=1914977 RepID=UPI0025FD84CE|nr:Mu transposase C-terminal domain-containing protein [Undibacterium sp.]
MTQAALKTHYSAAELAGMHLPGLPATSFNINAKASRDGWPFNEVKGRGGLRREYAPPAEVLAAIRNKTAQRLVALATPTSSDLTVIAPLPGNYTPEQILKGDARKGVNAAVEQVMQRTGYPLKKAVRTLLTLVRQGEASPQLVAMLKLARDGRGLASLDGLPSERSLVRFVEYQKTGQLVPKQREKNMSVPTWAKAFLGFYQQPQKPTVAHAYQQFADAYEEKAQGALPSVHQVRRFLLKMGEVSLQSGRMGSREIKNIKGFVRRDTGHMWPGDAYTADGHCFDAEIAHPRHGRPFRPEITCVLDIATRRVVGWSIDLAESGLAVLDALRSAVENGGICSTLYVDNGSGYCNAMISAPGVGLTARLGIVMEHSIAYNSQARGIIERSHQSIWVKAAKELPSYMGVDMDRQAKQVVHKITRKDIKESGKSKLLMSFPEFVRFCNTKVDAYNATPHSSLEKMVDASTGRKRSMSPNEAWAHGVAEGAQLVMVTPEQAQHLFRPQKECKVLRCEINLFSNRYYAKELEEHHGAVVRVGYNVSNASKIWVHDSEGRFICEAGFEANKKAYFAETKLEQNARVRAQGREKLLLVKLDEVQAELEGSIAPFTLENNPSPTLTLPLTGLELVEADYAPRPALKLVAAEMAEQTPAEPAGRPLFEVESEQYEWLMEHQDTWTENDARFFQRYVVEDDGYSLLAERFDLLGLAWGAAEQAALNNLMAKQKQG